MSNAISVVVIVLVALLMGFRSPAGVLAWLAVAGILVLFTLTLTCSVAETSTLSATVNRDSLEPRALQLTPFEVVSGERHEDILAPPWRYFQNTYRVRLLGSEFFGQDVKLPSFGITYRVVSNANATAGQEQTLLLPALPMRAGSGSFARRIVQIQSKTWRGVGSAMPVSATLRSSSR